MKMGVMSKSDLRLQAKMKPVELKIRREGRNEIGGWKKRRGGKRGEGLLWRQ